MVRPAAVQGLVVVDLGRGMAAALLDKLFADLGAQVWRPAGSRPDPFDTLYPAHPFWRAGARVVADGDLDDTLARADVVITGGEDHPELAPHHDATALARAHPGLVVIELTGYVPGSTMAGPAVEILVQASSGMSWEHFSDRPLAFGVPFASYGQVLTGFVGVWAALVERQSSGLGQVVGASLQQGAGMFMAPFWMDAERSDAEFAKVAPKDSNHLIFRCAGGDYVQLVLGVPQAVVKLYRALDIDLPADPADRGLPRPGAGPGKYFGDTELYAPAVAKLSRDEVVARCTREGIPVAPVLDPGELWTHEQVAHARVLLERDGHRTAGFPVTFEACHDSVGTPRPEKVTGSSTGPLSGLRVLDAGSFMAGPYVSKVLQELGADVVKIEPVTGEPLRGMARTFVLIASGKRVLPLDAKTSFGREVVARLVARCDAVNHNYRPGVAARMGLDPDTLRRVNPDLITLDTTGFGPDGPLALDPAFDMVVQALTGLEVRAGGRDNPPLWYRLPYTDLVSAMLGAAGLLIAYWERGETGGAFDLGTSLLRAALFMISDLVQRPDGSFLPSPVLDHAQLGFHPAERLYQTLDGWVAVAARDEASAARLADAFGLDLGPRATWGTSSASGIAREVGARITAEVLAALAAAAVWSAECRPDGFSLLAADSAAVRAGMLVDREDDTYGTVRSITGPLVTFSRSTVTVHGLRSAPRLGADTREILEDLGFSDADIAAAYAAAAVR